MPDGAVFMPDGATEIAWQEQDRCYRQVARPQDR